MAGEAFEAYLEQYNQLEGNVKQMEELLESITDNWTNTRIQWQNATAKMGSFGLN